MTENDVCLFFSLCDGVGPKTFLKLIHQFGSAKEAFERLSDKEYKNTVISQRLYEKFDSFRKTYDLDSYLEKLKKAKVNIVGYTDKQYPDLLKQLDNPPIVLYCKGNLDLLRSERTMGVVGARKITSYGKDVTEKLVSELVFNGMTIVSGLAFGVDAVAHSSAIKNQGSTIAVLGCGVDCCTPLENQDLYESILDSNSLILSEYPLGMPPSAGSFPARNRIIAGLSLGVLIPEAAEDSGSLITADEAHKLGRPIFAVPGSINSIMSRGAIKLLKEGASLVSSGEDIIKNFKFPISNFKSMSKLQNIKLSKEERKVVELVENEPMSLDFISKQTNMPITKLMVIVSGLEMRGIFENRSGEISLKSSN